MNGANYLYIGPTIKSQEFVTRFRVCPLPTDPLFYSSPHECNNKARVKVFNILDPQEKERAKQLPYLSSRLYKTELILFNLHPNQIRMERGRRNDTESPLRLNERQNPAAPRKNPMMGPGPKTWTPRGPPRSNLGGVGRGTNDGLAGGKRFSFFL